MRIRPHSIALAALLAWAGCPAPAVYQTADTLEPGAWQFGGAGGVVAFRDIEQETRLVGGDVEGFIRRGMAPNLDVGVRLYTLGVEGSIKWRFHQERWSLATMPGLAVLRSPETLLTTDAWHAFVSVPLIASRRFSRRWSISVGPKALTGLYWSNASSPQLGAALGGYAMVALHLGNWRIMPEVDLARTVAGTVPVNGWISHLGIGFAWQR